MILRENCVTKEYAVGLGRMNYDNLEQHFFAYAKFPYLEQAEEELATLKLLSKNPLSKDYVIVEITTTTIGKFLK